MPPLSPSNSNPTATLLPPESHSHFLPLPLSHQKCLSNSLQGTFCPSSLRSASSSLLHCRTKHCREGSDGFRDSLFASSASQVDVHQFWLSSMTTTHQEGSHEPHIRFCAIVFFMNAGGKPTASQKYLDCMRYKVIKMTITHPGGML